MDLKNSHIMTAMVTPFGKDGNVDYELLKNSIREQINSNKPTEEQICKKLLQKRR